MALYPGLDSSKAAKRHVRYAQSLVDAGFDFELHAAQQHDGPVDVLMREAVMQARDDQAAADEQSRGASDGNDGALGASDAATAATPPPAEEPASALDDATASAAPGTSATTPFTLLPQDSGILARSPQGELAGAVIVTAVQFDERTALFIRALGVAPQFRSKGIGTVLIGMTPQVLVQAGLPSSSRLVTEVPLVRASFFHRAGLVVEAPGADVPEALAQIAGEVLPSYGDAACWAHMDVK